MISRAVALGPDKRPVDSFVWRHPLISMALLILPIGIVIDAMLEITLVRTGFYIYSQVIPFGSVFAGETYQFPFIWETVMVTFWVSAKRPSEAINVTL